MSCSPSKLIHSADTQARPVVITIFTRSVCLSVLPFIPTFQNLAKQNNIQLKIVIATGGTGGLAEWIIDEFSK